MDCNPLVSIGIPTFNRPEGLKSTLERITSQSYRNIEIIISDNCSDNSLVKGVIADFIKKDSRIKSFTQGINIGAANNFKFVLRNSSGSYFMWAADDDEWSTEFVQELMSIIGDHSAAFCNYSVLYRSISKIVNVDIHNSASGATRYDQARNFLVERVPSMFYSIYKREDIIWFLDSSKVFDWFDCYAIFRIVLLSNGFAISQKRLFTAGIKGSQYENKPFNPSKKRIYCYNDYLKQSIIVILKSKVSFLQKLKLTFYLFEVNTRSFLSIETGRKNYKLYFYLYKAYSVLVPKVKIIRLY